MFPFFFPYREWLNAHPRIKEHIVSEIGHVDLGGDKPIRRPMKQYGHIDVTIRPVRAACPAAEEDGLRHSVA